MGRSIIILMVILCCGFANSFATEYYVSSSGKDSNNGISAESPWQTLTKVSNFKFKEGDIIRLKGGNVFYESLSLSQLNGTDEKPIIFTSYGNGNATISGSKAITNWTEGGTNIWFAGVESEVFQLFRRDTVLTTARIPKVKGMYAGDENFYHVSSVVNSNYSFICDELKGAHDIVGATLHVGTWEWLLKTAEISAFDPATGKVTVKTDIFDNFAKGNRFFINNHINLLTKEGDWIYDEDQKRIVLYSHNRPENITGAMQTGSGIVISGGKNIQLANINIEHFNKDGINSNGAQNLVIKDCNVDYNYGFGIQTRGKPSLLIEGCKVTGTTTFAILNYVDSAVIKNCLIKDVGLAHQLNKNGFSVGGGISSNGYRDSIKNNICLNIGYNAIRFKDHAIIKNNNVKYVNLTTIDGGAIYTYEGNGGQIIDNVVQCHDELKDLRTHGIYIDNNSHDMTISGNTAIGFNNNILVNSGAYGISMDHNVLFGATNAGFSVSKARSIAFYNNQIFNTIADVPPVYITGMSDWTQLKCDSNKYFNALGFATSYVSSDGFYGLSEWQNMTGNDMYSLENDSVLTGILNEDGSDIVSNFSFDTGSEGWKCWNTEVKHVERIDNNFCLYDTLEANKTKGRLFKNGFVLEKGEDYVLEFDFRTTRTARAYIDLVDVDNFKHLDTHRFLVKPEWKQYRIILENVSRACLNGTISFYCEYSNYAYTTPNAFFLDNLRLTKLKTKAVKQSYKLICNETKEETSFDLEGGWRDLAGNVFLNEISLPPFQSKILIQSQPDLVTIPLKKGWNNIAFERGRVYSEFQDLFFTLIQDGKLIKVQDEQGNTLEDFGSSEWINMSIKDFDRNAFRVRVSEDCSLNYKAYRTDLQPKVMLRKGWNLLPYSGENPLSANKVLKQIIENGALVCVKNNDGTTIEPDEAGVWPIEIGLFYPGKSYEVKLNKEHLFTFQ